MTFTFTTFTSEVTVIGGNNKIQTKKVTDAHLTDFKYYFIQFASLKVQNSCIELGSGDVY